MPNGHLREQDAVAILASGDLRRIDLAIRNLPEVFRPLLGNVVDKWDQYSPNVKRAIIQSAEERYQVAQAQAPEPTPESTSSALSELFPELAGGGMPGGGAPTVTKQQNAGGEKPLPPLNLPPWYPWPPLDNLGELDLQEVAAAYKQWGDPYEVGAPAYTDKEVWQRDTELMTLDTPRTPSPDSTRYMEEQGWVRLGRLPEGMTQEEFAASVHGVRSAEEIPPVSSGKASAEQHELPKGQPRFISDGTYDWEWNPKTGQYDTLIGHTTKGEEKEPPVGQRFSTPEEAQAAANAAGKATGRKYQVGTQVMSDGSVIYTIEEAQVEKPPWAEEAPEGYRWERDAQGEWKLQPYKPPARSIDELLTSALADAFVSGDWSAALELNRFMGQPSAMQKFEAAMQYATAPGDYMTVLGMMRGELPIQQQPGQYGRVAAPPDFLQGAAQELFEPTFGGAAKDALQAQVMRPSAGVGEVIFAKPDGSQVSAIPGSAQARQYEAQGFVNTGESSAARTTYGPGYGPGSQEFARPSVQDNAARLRQEQERIFAITEGAEAQRQAGTIAGDQYRTIFEDAQRQLAEANRRYGQPTAQPVLTPPPSRGAPSWMPPAVKTVGLEGGALARPGQLTEAGALRLPSAQAWRRMAIPEQQMFTRSLELQGVSGPWLEEYQRRWRETAIPASRQYGRISAQPGRIF